MFPAPPAGNEPVAALAVEARQKCSPAPAGMNRYLPKFPNESVSVPRARGDEPLRAG